MGLFDSIFSASTTKVENSVNLPDYINEASKANIAETERVTSEPYQAYSGPRVAGFRPDQLSAFNLTRSNVGSYQPYQDAATQGTAGAFQRYDDPVPVESYGPEATTEDYGEAAPFDRFSEADIAGYMNPFTEEVTNRALRQLRREGSRARHEINAGRVSKGAFGGARHAIQEGLQREGELRAGGDLAANLYSGAFSNAQQAYMTDEARRLESERLNRQQFSTDAARELQTDELNRRTFTSDADRSLAAERLAREQFNTDSRRSLDAAKVLADLGITQQSAGMRDAAALSAIGAEQQGQDQREVDVDYSDFLQQRDWPLQMLNQRYAALQSTPYESNKTGDHPGPSVAGQVGGLALSALALPDFLKSFS